MCTIINFNSKNKVKFLFRQITQEKLNNEDIENYFMLLINFTYLPKFENSVLKHKF